MEHEKYMELALRLASEAALDGEVPVGCVIVAADGSVLGVGRNRRESGRDATAHAEIEAIRAAGAAGGSWRLDGCTMYVTLEPCPMCAGAVINSRLGAVYYGAPDPIGGACGSVIDLFFERFGHSPRVFPGLLADESAELLRGFFGTLRK